MTDVVADKGKAADIQIRHLGNGRFEVTDRHGKHEATEGVPIIMHRLARRAARGRAAGVQHERGVTGGDAALTYAPRPSASP